MTTTEAEESKPGILPEHLGRFIDLLAADLSPGGDLVVYAANTRDGATTCESSVLWLLPAAGGSSHRLAARSDGSQSAPSFSPDGRQVVFLQEVDGRDQVAVLDVGEGTVRVLTDFGRGVAAVAPTFAPDGSAVLFAGCADPPRDPKRAYRVTRPLWRHDGMGLVEDVRCDVHLIPSQGGEARRVTFHDGIVSGLQFSPDGKAVLYSCFAEPGSSDFTLRTVPTSGNASPAELMRGAYLVYPPAAAWLPDGRVLHTTAWEVSRPLDLMVVDPRDGTSTRLGIDVAGQIFGYLQPAMNGALLEPRLVIDGASERCLLYVQNGGRLDTCSISLLGAPAVTVIAGSSSSTVPVSLRGSRLLAARTSFTAPLDLYLVDLHESRQDQQPRHAPQRLTSLNERWSAGAPFAVHSLHFRAEDGTAVEGWFLEPSRGEPPYPTVLNIHGGPFAGHGEMFSLDDHLFASAGLGVLSINFRGSSGYGEAFAAPLWGDWGRLDAGDVLDGLDAAIAQGWVDSDRVGSFGLSGGGYLTSWLLTHSERFAAGVAECPVTDWSGMVGSDIPQLVSRWMGSKPGRGPEAMAAYARVAPLTYAADCATPLLLVAHESDLRCPAGQADVLFSALAMAGREVEMLRLPGMSHTGVYGLRDLAGRQDRAEAVLDWFTRRLMPGAGA